MRSKLGAMGAVLYLLIMCGGVYGLFDNSMSASPFYDGVAMVRASAVDRVGPKMALLTTPWGLDARF